MPDVSPDLTARLGTMLARMDRYAHDDEARKAKLEPRRYKLSRRFEGRNSTNYHYVSAGRDGRGREVRFCWSIHRNIAGYFLSWREVRLQSGGKRDQWAARKVRRRAQELAERRAARMKAKASPSPGD